MIRHFVSDLDGTLLNREGEWDDVLSEGIQKLLDGGCDFAAATGRTINGVKNCAGLWELPVYLILMNGAVILDKKRQIIFMKEISRNTKQAVLDIWGNANLEFIRTDGILTKLDRDTYLREYGRWDIWRQKVLEKQADGYYESYLDRITFNVTDQEILSAPVLKINGLQLDDAKYAKMLKEVDGLPEAVNAPFADYVLEITASNVSKADALSKLSARLKWKKEETAVFGDGGNDAGMLRTFPHSYAPKNACGQAKEAASEVLENGEEYSVLRKMLELLSAE